LLIPPALTTLIVVGVDQNWWGGGLVDGWEAEFAWACGLGVALALLGLLGSWGLRRLRPAGRLARITPLLLCLGALAGYWFYDTRPPDLRELRAAPQPIYYLGSSFEGLRLTHAERRGSGAFLAYGDCDLALGQSEGGCGVPLQLQNVMCPGERPGVVVFASLGGGQAYRAIRALRAVRSDAPRRRPRAAVGSNPFGPCYPQ
jgi:hypothetical protein